MTNTEKKAAKAKAKRIAKFAKQVAKAMAKFEDDCVVRMSK